MKKNVLFLLLVVAFMFSAGSQHVCAQSNRESSMSSFFSYKNNQAYKLLSWFAHPSNSFRSGSCDVSGEYVDLTIHSVKYRICIRLHKNGSRFDNLEVLEDNDWWPAFSATNGWKDIIIDFWRGYDTTTLRLIENLFGRLNNLSCERMCLATLTVLLWKSPYSQDYSSTQSSLSNNDNDVFFENVLSKRKLTESDLSGKTKEDISMMKNGLYAHHGFIFSNENLFNYYSVYPWYNPSISDPTTVNRYFSEIEKFNLDFLKRHEQ